MNAVGIDVGKGIFTLVRDNTESSSRSFTIRYHLNPVDHLIQKLKGLNEITKVVRKSTGGTNQVFKR